jgi:uncharacterized protein (DUF2236 family)
MRPFESAPHARLPWPLRGYAERAVRDFLRPDGGPAPDFTEPAGEPALAPPDSISWLIFKNPVSVFMGGVAAVILELAEPRVRAGVWEHTSFRTDPLSRLRRTGLAAMTTVYGARSIAEAMIARVSALHARIEGVTECGQPYNASDPELLDWVQATASYGFAQSFHAYVRPLSWEERDRQLAEGQTAARLYGATGAPASLAELDGLFIRMRPQLEPSEIVFSFLRIMRGTPILPPPAGALQTPLIKAAVAIVPAWARALLGLGADWTPNALDIAAARYAARAADRIVLDESPASQACRRLGLPGDWLWRR